MDKWDQSMLYRPANMSDGRQFPRNNEEHPIAADGNWEKAFFLTTGKRPKDLGLTSEKQAYWWLEVNRVGGM